MKDCRDGKEDKEIQTKDVQERREAVSGDGFGQAGPHQGEQEPPAAQQGRPDQGPVLQDDRGHGPRRQEARPPIGSLPVKVQGQSPGVICFNPLPGLAVSSLGGDG